MSLTGRPPGLADLDGEHRVELVVDPNWRAEVHLYVLDEAGRPAAIADEVTLRFSLPAAEVAPIQRQPSAVGPGHSVHTGPELSIPGTWTIQVVADLSEFERHTATFEAPVGR